MPSSEKTRSRRRQPGRRREEGSLAWLAKRRDSDGQPLMSVAQLQAGERLREDFWRASLNPRVTTDWSPAACGRGTKRATAGAGVEMSDVVMAARLRVNRALAAVGPELSGILIDVCCHLKGLEATERMARWPQRSGKVVLLLALTRLARHYGLDRTAEPAPSRSCIRHWGSVDYRPELNLADGTSA